MHCDQKFKKIKFYAKDYDEKKVKNIEKKCKKKKIILEIIDSKKNNKYENEEEIEKEYYDKEEDNAYETNKNINIPKPKIIKEKIINTILNSNILEIKQEKFLLSFFNKRYNFNRIYYAWSSYSNHINNLYSLLEKTIKSLMIIETKEGNIFGFFLDKKEKNNSFIFSILTEELVYDDKLEIDIEAHYNANAKFYLKNYFYLGKDFLYSNNNKFFSNKLKMKEKKFTCKLIEIYKVY